MADGRDSWDHVPVPLAARSPQDLALLGLDCLQDFEEARRREGPDQLALATAAQAYAMLALAFADPSINPARPGDGRHAAGPPSAAAVLEFLREFGPESGDAQAVGRAIALIEEAEHG